jgi:hypothetical protein
VAASGKYIGLVMLGFAIATLIRRDDSLGTKKKCFGFIGAFVIVAAVINYPAVTALPDLAGGFGGEIARLNSRSGTDIEFGRFGWLERLLDIPLFLLLLYLFQVARLRHLARPDLLLTMFPFVLGLILSFSSKQSGRHMLPALVLIAFVASMAAIGLAKELSARRVELGSAIVTTFLLSAFAYEAFATLRFDDGFRGDYRRELVDWININVPLRGAVAVEHRVGIPNEHSRRFCELPSPLRQQVRGARFAADLGSLDELRGAGITHVATTDSQPKVFLKEEVSAAQRDDATFRRRREFYLRLLKEGRLVWSRETGNVGVLNPGLRLYEIASPASAPTP